MCIINRIRPEPVSVIFTACHLADTSGIQTNLHLQKHMIYSRCTQ